MRLSRLRGPVAFGFLIFPRAPLRNLPWCCCFWGGAGSRNRLIWRCTPNPYIIIYSHVGIAFPMSSRYATGLEHRVHCSCGSYQRMLSVRCNWCSLAAKSNAGQGLYVFAARVPMYKYNGISYLRTDWRVRSNKIHSCIIESYYSLLALLFWLNEDIDIGYL